MRWLFAALALCLSFGSAAWILPPGWQSAQPNPEPDLNDLIAALDETVPARMRITNTPGAAVAVVRGGELVWTKGYGLADLASRQPVTDGSLFEVASISKTVTAWGVLALAETGRIDLDAPVEQNLSRWHIPRSSYDSRGVTIRRLLSHTAGLNTPEYLGYLPGRPLPSIEMVLADGDGHTPGLRLAAPPGENFAYSDGDYLLLQLLIEEVSGEPFDRYMQRTILDPLGLQDATFNRSPAIEERTVTSYDPYRKPLPSYRFVELAPAGLTISAADLARFVAAMMPGPNGALAGRGVLSPDAVRSLLTPQAKLRFPENLIYASEYGLGVYIDPLPGDGTLISHMGGNLNGVTEFVARPETGDAIIVLTTSIAGHEVFADAVSLWTDWLGSPPATLPRAIQVSRRLLGLASSLLGWVGMILCAALLWERRKGRRNITLQGDPRPRWVRSVLALAPLAALWIYFTRLDPQLRLAMPSAAGSMAVGVSGVLLAALIWGLSSKTAQDSSMQPAASETFQPIV